MKWLLACTIGEALGIAAVATTYAAIDRGLLAPAPRAALRIELALRALPR